jgi:hypothetical protein
MTSSLLLKSAIAVIYQGTQLLLGSLMSGFEVCSVPAVMEVYEVCAKIKF